MSTTRLKELDQILFTNSARNMPHLFWSNKGKNSVVAKRTNPYLSTSARPGIHRLSQNTSNSPSVYRETVLKKDQSTRIGLLLLIASVCLLAVGSGMQMGYSLVSHASLNVSESKSKEANVYARLESAHKWAIPLGASLAVAIVDGIGRRTTLIFSLLPSLVGWTLLASTTSSLTLILGQLLNGISLGMKCGPIFIYISECTDSLWRAPLLCLTYISFSTGQILIHALREHYDSFHLARFELVPSFFALILLFLAPESPIWLAWAGKHEKALGVLRWLRGNEAHAQEELSDITEHIQQDNRIERNEMESIWETCTRLQVLKPLIIICVFQILGLISYAYMHIVTSVVSLNEWTIFPDSIDRMYAAVGIMALFLVAPRRSIFVTAGAISAANIFFYGFYLHYHQVNLNTDFIMKWVVSLVYHSTFAAFDIAVLLVIAELLPGRVRGSISAYIFAIFFLVDNCLGFIFTPSTVILDMWPILNASGIFIVLALATLAASGLIYMWLPETKNKSLTEIEHECKAHQWFYDQRRSQCKAVNTEDVENAN